MQTLKMTLIAIFLILHLAIHDIITICMIIQKENWVEKCFKKCLPDVPYVKDIVLGQGRVFLFVFPMAIDALSGSTFSNDIPLFRYLFYAAPVLALLNVFVMMFKYFKEKKKLNETQKELAKLDKQDKK